jgi:diguanylate cyclase (GGDEF)-like protein
MVQVGQRPDVERLKVLIVEDNPADAELAEIYLSSKYEVKVASRVTAAISILRAGTFDAVLTDLTLPDASGLEAVTKLQSVSQDPALIVVTGLDDEAIGQRAVELGAQDYLVKGRFDEESLDRAMRYATERKRSEKRLSQLAHFDQLTGLANRATFRDRLQVIIEHARRKGLQFTVMYLDLDDFKSTNDSFGHDCGDQVLREVSNRLLATVRGYDTAARLGGDEFALLFDHQGDDITPTQLIDRVVDAFFAPLQIGDESFKIAASIGVATFPEAGDTEAELLKAADIAMFWAKDRIGTSYVVYDRSYAQEALPKRRIEAQLRKAYATNEFVLQFQPVVSLSDRQIASVEALIRWRRDDGTLVPPMEFIPALETSGLIVDVGAWVIHEACRCAAAWRREGKPVRVAVNISPRQFEVEGLVATTQRALVENCLEPDSLEVEITEGLLMRDTLQTKRTLRGLKDLGVRIAIDDFGTGYSSLAYLHKFAVDTLKIDRSFVNRIEEQKEGAVLTSAIISLGHKLGLDVIAEGVETEGQLARLLDDGCDFGQGFYLGRPAFDWTVAKADRGAS